MFDYLNNPAGVPPSFGGGSSQAGMPTFQGTQLPSGAPSTTGLFSGNLPGGLRSPQMLNLLGMAGQPMNTNYPARLGAALMGGNGGFLQALQQGMNAPGNNAAPPAVNWLTSLPQAPAPTPQPVVQFGNNGGPLTPAQQIVQNYQKFYPNTPVPQGALNDANNPAAYWARQDSLNGGHK